ncbi:bacteriohemerythrin [Propionivibrio limicola]|uniref:bacteriohemerythrin n=1 Tax=Propionivibrio limicola TaxID=167645 RepID=UPI001291DFB0|nr:bacteriohemerythrin [Propionivibrio limicola]
MTLLSWSPEYSIGNDLVDSEHEHLFLLVNSFHSHWQEAHDRHTIARLLTLLVAYAETHFQHEEQVMEAAGFPDLEEHRQVHSRMVDTIFALQQSFEDGSLRLEMETMKFIKSWLLEHILQADYRFRDFLAKKKTVVETAPQPPTAKADEQSVETTQQ